MPRSQEAHQPLWERVATFSSGFILICAILWIALVVPYPTDFQYTIFRIILALSGAAFAALIPGVMDLKYRGLIRAGGAIAVLVIIYFFTVSPPTAVETESSVKITGDCNVIGETTSINCNNN